MEECSPLGAIEYISFDQGDDVFGFGRLQYDGDWANYELYSEFTEGEHMAFQPIVPA